MTTRTLVILRHAKAAAPDGVADIDRPLTDRGHADAAGAGAWLAHHDIAPDLVLCSPARRTRETWHAVALALGAGPYVRYDDQVYAASATQLLRLIHAVSDERTTVLLIGHNPGLSQLTTLLDPQLGELEGLRTAGIAIHTWDGSWADCSPRVAGRVSVHTARA